MDSNVQSSTANHYEKIAIDGCVVRLNFARESNKNVLHNIEKILRNSYRKSPENTSVR